MEETAQAPSSSSQRIHELLLIVKKGGKKEGVLYRKMPVDKYGRNDRIRKTFLYATGSFQGASLVLELKESESE